MVLRVHILECDGELPRGGRIVRSAEDLVQLNDVLVRAVAAAGPDEELWMTDPHLVDFIPKRHGALIEVSRQMDLLSALDAAYGPLPATLTRQFAEQWLGPPHPEGIPLLQLLLARVLGIGELSRPGARVSLTAAVESVIRAEAAFSEPLVQEAWATHGPSDAVGTGTNPGLLRNPLAAPALIVARLLTNYPQHARATVLEATNWRGPTGSGLLTLAQQLDMPDPRVLGAERLASLAALLRPVLGVMSLDEYLATVSGRLEAELEVLLERVDIGQFDIGISLDAIRGRFSWLLQVDSAMAVRFERFAEVRATAAQLAPPRAGAESIDAATTGMEQWVDYFTHRFLPAVATWRRLGQPRDGPLAEALFAADGAFAQWVAGAYPKLKTLPSPPLAYRKIRAHSQGGIRIVVLVDALAYELLEMLREEAHAVGIWLSEEAPWLASLPTVTEIGMLTSVAGLPADVAWSEDTYQTEEARRRREQLLRQRQPGALVRVVFQVDQVEEVLRTPSHLYVLVWPDVDFGAHRYADFEMFGDHARVSLRHLLRAIARAVEVHPHLRLKKDELRLVISADHGWTDLLKIEAATRPPIEAAKAHHRLYEVPRRLGAEEIAGLESDWIAIEGGTFDLPEGRTYLIPADNRAIVRGVARQHGGLSQGEVLVPVALGSFLRPPYRAPAIAAIVAEPLQKDQRGQISIVISNPNEGALLNLRLTCLQLDLYAEIERVSDRSSGTFGRFLVRPRASGAIEHVNVELSYEGDAIGPQVLRLEAPVHVALTVEERMAGDYTRVDSLFNELG